MNLDFSFNMWHQFLSVSEKVIFRYIKIESQVNVIPKWSGNWKLIQNSVIWCALTIIINLNYSSIHSSLLFCVPWKKSGSNLNNSVSLLRLFVKNSPHKILKFEIFKWKLFYFALPNSLSRCGTLIWRHYEIADKYSR